jgi:hypothetical protein
MTVTGAISYVDALKILATEVLEIDQKLMGLVSSAGNRFDCYKLTKRYEQSLSRFERQLSLAEDSNLKVELIISFLKELAFFENEFLKIVRR